MFKKIKKIISLIFIALFLGMAWLWNDLNSYLDTPIKLESTQDYELKPGYNFINVILDLKEKEILNNPRYLRWYGRISGLEREIKAGEYQIEPGMTPRQLVIMFTAGKVRQYAITIIEGWTFKQMMQVINAHPSLQHELTGLSDEEIMQKIGHEGEHPEGRFLPDTYNFPKGLSDTAFLKRAYKAMDTYLKEQWESRAVGLPYKGPYDALIMASIVEKETGQASERQAISGVFVRRLQKRMRLQTDPTVIYGMGEKYKGNIRKRDLQRDTPYNTYRRFGLPPTPIAMPGREAISASLHPDDSENIYFVSRGDGSHQFSASLDEHNQAVIKYQLKGRRKPFSSYNP